MKYVIILILTLFCFQPTLAFAQETGAEGQILCGPGVESDCVCSLNGTKFALTTPTGLTEAACTDYCRLNWMQNQGIFAQNSNFGQSTLDINKITGAMVCDIVAAEPSEPAREAIFPCLNIPIPGLKFGNCDATGIDPNADKSIISLSGGRQQTNLLGTYVEAMYQFLLIAGAIVAVTMLMIAGLQYATARGQSKQVEQAKKRINNAVVGIILLLLAYNIAFVLNPGTVAFSSLGFDTVAAQQLNASTSGPEGIMGFPVASGSWENLSSPYKDIAKLAKAKPENCTMPNGFASPTGGTLPNQSMHHWEDALNQKNYLAIDRFDWANGWGAPIYSPVDATSITYHTSTSTANKCGNHIDLTTATGELVQICHAKDYLDVNGKKLTGNVKQGTVIGHTGGKCCAGSKAPPGWWSKCDVSGTPCNPEVASSCTCQSIEQAGNTTGPHIHITMSGGTGNMLACLKEFTPGTTQVSPTQQTPTP